MLATVNFDSGAREAFAALRRHRPRSPLMCMELWCGWFTHWGPSRRPGTAEAAGALREILECGASVNLYMAHGSTNFGGWAGANRSGELHDGALRPTTTSYDYDAPIDERGAPTEKFWRFREVLAAHAPGPLPAPPPVPPSLGRPVAVRLDRWAPLEGVLDALGGPETHTATPPTFEELDVDRGVVRYRLEVPGPRPPYPLRVLGLRDRALATVDGVRATVLDERDALLGEVAGPATVDLWVESLGRVNYGPRLAEPKGITGGVLHEWQYLHGVRARPAAARRGRAARGAGADRVPAGAGGRGARPVRRLLRGGRAG